MIERVQLAGVLHDIGKIAVPDAILNKPGPLTPEEWEAMRKHPEFGRRILEPMSWDLAARVLAHHEQPDGTGYPFGLTGEQIPLAARIFAVADSYEAMTTDRVYRPQHWPHRRAGGAPARRLPAPSSTPASSLPS